jgi:RNA polymerase sigma-70 factor (ECF subfamily)
MQDQSALIKRAKKGDETAFSELVKATEASVYRYLYAMVKSHEDALDLSQETYLRLWRTLGSYRGDCSPTTWILRIAKNTAIDHIRKTAKTGDVIPLTYPDKDGIETSFDLPDTDTDANPEEALSRKQTREAVRKAILSLPEEQRDVIVLREFEDLSYEEIAARLSLEIGTVKSRLSRARHAIKDFLISGNFL